MMVDYDYRDIMTPIVEYIEQVNSVEFPNQLTTVVIPEFVPERLMDRIIRNQTAVRLRWLLRGYKDIVIFEYPSRSTLPYNAVTTAGGNTILTQFTNRRREGPV